MSVTFWLIFVADTKIILGQYFGAPIKSTENRQNMIRTILTEFRNTAQL